MGKTGVVACIAVYQIALFLYEHWGVRKSESIKFYSLHFNISHGHKKVGKV